MIQLFNIQDKFQKVTEYWSPKIAGELNGQYVKLVKAKGEMIWHSHDDEDELFMIFKGTFVMEFRDHTATVGPGEVLIVPKGVEHCPRTEGDEEVWLILFEPKATKHTGNIDHEMTKHLQDWI
jgi:mannose-6-phosphate isomerase-like protein (cupin superfamily)